MTESLKNTSDMARVRELSERDITQLTQGIMLTNDDIEEEEQDLDFLRNIPSSDDDLINALIIDSSKKSVNSELSVPNFQDIRPKMKDIYGNNKLLKLVRKKGVGGVIPEECQVSLQYLGFFEYQDEPFDSTFAHDKSYLDVRMNQNNLIPGLQLGIATMEKHETSIFLIHPDLAFGELGCMPRIPPNSEVLFVVKMLSFNDDAELLRELHPSEKKSFMAMMPKIKEIMADARVCFETQKYVLATRKYEKAADWIKSMRLNNDEEEDEMNHLLARVCNNLAVCYNKRGKPRKACTVCNENPIPSAKSNFQNGRALGRIGQFSEGLAKLNKALIIERNNDAIKEEIKLVKKMKDEYNDLLEKLKSHSSGETDGIVDDEFRKTAKEICVKFEKETDQLRQVLPKNLGASETKCIENFAASYGLNYTTHIVGHKTEVYLSKKNY